LSLPDGSPDPYHRCLHHMPVIHYITSTVLLVLLLVFIYRYQNLHYPGPVIVNTLFVFLWSFSGGSKLACNTFACAQFWDSLEHAALAVVPLTWLIYNLFFTGRRSILQYPRHVPLLVLPALILVLLATNSSHALLFKYAEGLFGTAAVVNKTYRPLILIIPFNSLLLGSLAAASLMRRLPQVPSEQRVHIWMHLLCTCLPWVGGLLDSFGWQPYTGFSSMPFTLLLSILVASWSILRYRIGDIIPIARDVAFESLKEPVLVIDRDNRLVDLNPAALQLLHLPRKSSLGKCFDKLFPDLAPALAGERTGERAGSQALRWQMGDRAFDVRISSLEDGNRTDIGRVIVLHDVSELVRKEAEAALKKREAFFRALIQYSSDMVLILNRKGEINYISPSIEMVLGFSADRWLDRSFFDFIHPEDRSEVKKTFGMCLGQPGTVYTIRLRIRHEDGAWRYIEAMASNRLEDPAVMGLVVNARDITERVRVEQLLRHNAFHDSLTGLPNRALFQDRLQQAILRCQRNPKELFAVFFLDMDHFKVINDSRGHDTGDSFLIEISHLLSQGIRKLDTLARWGGDEFVILAEGVHGAEDVNRIAERILDSLKAPILVGEQKFFPTASIGIVLGKPDYQRPEEVLRDADIAMYRAKMKGKACSVIFDPSMHLQAVSRLELERELHQAMENEDLELYYQPIYSVAQKRTTGFEALLRWKHPVHGKIRPAEFIPIAEESGLIFPLGRWVLMQACRQARAWQKRLPSAPPLEISVNISSLQFARVDFVQEVEECLQQAQLAPGSLTLEITESLLMLNNEVVSRNIRRLVELGIQLSIDDFGTGFSSFGYIQRFPIRTIKIDRSFIQDIARKSQSSEIVEPILRYANVLGLRTVAEGVETREQIAKLNELGCSYLQGFYIARPMAADKVEAYLAAERERDLSRKAPKDKRGPALLPASMQ